MSKQQIYDALRKAGISHAGAIGIMGNLQAESGCEACRLQGDYELGRSKSKTYAAKVDSGELSKHIFSRDACGWGLAQWTWYTRKENLYDRAKAEKKSVGDLDLQVGFLIWELKEYFPQLFAFLKVTTSVWNSTKRVCEEYEQPAVNNIQARYAMAQAIESELTAAPTADYWPPRTIDKSMKGPDVEVLQAVLKARGYAVNYVGGVFDALLETEVKKFQKDHGLDCDGICGPLTWQKVLEVNV